WLGGKLPTTRQWDKAAGLYDDPHPSRGPFRDGWDEKDPAQIAVGQRKAPLEVGQASHDVSTYGVRDLAGNGREWARDTDERDQQVPVADPAPRLLVFLRGCSFHARQPLRFLDLKEVPDSAAYRPNPKESETPDIGFRVVIEIE